MSGELLLEVKALNLSLPQGSGHIGILSNVSFNIGRGESFGLVGESGSGKSQLLMALLGLSPAGATVSGSARFDGRELFGASREQWRSIRGASIAMVFQDPNAALNPYLTIEQQLTEALRAHRAVTSSVARDRAIELLNQVRIAEPARRMRQYPHELSGGMKQRVMIAMALMCEPKLLLCDEPTTALDVSVQAEVILLLQQLRRDTGISLLVVTHDFAVVSALTDHMGVMRHGALLEQGPTAALLRAPAHPYTAALQRSVLRLDTPLDQPVPTIPAPLAAVSHAS